MRWIRNSFHPYTWLEGIASLVANGDFYGVFIPLHFSLTLSIDIHDFRESFRDVLKKRQKLNLYFHEFFVFLIPVKNVDPNDSFCPENIFFWQSGLPKFYLCNVSLWIVSKSWQSKLRSTMVSQVSAGNR